MRIWKANFVSSKEMDKERATEHHEYRVTFLLFLSNRRLIEYQNGWGWKGPYRPSHLHLFLVHLLEKNGRFGFKDDVHKVLAINPVPYG